jgi:pilus assembly protein CpaB
MNIKKLWTYAILFGFLSSTILYFMVNSNQEPKVEKKIETTVQKAQVKKESSPSKPTKLLKISGGKRAISVTLNESQGVTGFISPGSFVDVVVVFSPEETTQIILERVKVLAVGRITGAVEDVQKNAYQTVTLEVTPEQGATLTYAVTKGTIQLMLRGFDDDSTFPEKIILGTKLRGGGVQ